MGAAVAIRRLDLTAAELRAAAGREKDGSAARRMLAIAMVLDGADRKVAAETCGMDRQTLRDWVHRYNAVGLRGLHDLKTPSPKPKLTAEQQAKLAELVEAGLILNCDVKNQDNNVTIDCEVDNFEKKKHLTPIVMPAYDTARATIDLVSFASGNGLVFVLDTFTDPGGNTTVVAPQQPDLAALSTAVARPDDFDKVLRLVLLISP